MLSLTFLKNSCHRAHIKSNVKQTKLEWTFGFFVVAMIKYSGQKSILEIEFIWFIFSSVIVYNRGKSWQELEQELIMKQWRNVACWLSCQLMFRELPHTAQDHLPRDCTGTVGWASLHLLEIKAVLRIHFCRPSSWSRQLIEGFLFLCSCATSV